MDQIWIAGLVALFVWWFSTGAILLVVQRADRGPAGAHLRAVLLGLPVLALGIWGLGWSFGTHSVAGVYVGFLAALAIWGWFELAFLAGVLTGPNTRSCPPDVPEWERFLRAWGTIAYSEMALILAMVAILAAGWGAENTVGLWTFVVLFLARILAKLNVYLGVPNINDQFLPQPVRHLASHFRRRPMNAFFPWSVTILTFAVACWVERMVAAPAGSADAVGFALLASLTSLALIEHWLMVVRVRDAALWAWAMPRPDPIRPDAAKAAGTEPKGTL